nr:hypothetical protein [Tanacetum cinerariifolium]
SSLSFHFPLFTAIIQGTDFRPLSMDIFLHEYSSLLPCHRSRVDPTLLNGFEMATDRNDDTPVPDLRTMEESCQPTLNGRSFNSYVMHVSHKGSREGRYRNGDDVPPAGGGDLPVLDLRMMEELCQPTLNVQNSFQFHGLSGDDPNKHLDKFSHVTQSIKVNGVTDDALRLYLFPHSLTHHATAWFDRLPRNFITTFKQMAKMFLGKYFPPYMVTKLRNEITNFRQRLDESLFEA